MIEDGYIPSTKLNGEQDACSFFKILIFFRKLFIFFHKLNICIFNSYVIFICHEANVWIGDA